MYVDSLLLKFNSDEKQLAHLSVRIWLHFKSHQRWSPPVVVGGPCDAMRSGVRMTITLPGHSMSVTQHYFNYK